MNQKAFDKETSINNKKYMKTEKTTKLKKPDEKKGITKKNTSKKENERS
jgi:hypothetical protein